MVFFGCFFERGRRRGKRERERERERERAGLGTHMKVTLKCLPLSFQFRKGPRGSGRPFGSTEESEITKAKFVTDGEVRKASDLSGNIRKNLGSQLRILISTAMVPHRRNFTAAIHDTITSTKLNFHVCLLEFLSQTVFTKKGATRNSDYRWTPTRTANLKSQSLKWSFHFSPQ